MSGVTKRSAPAAGLAVAAVVLLAAALLAACGAPEGGGAGGDGAGPPDVAGLVWLATDTGEGGWSLYVVATEGLASAYDRAIVTVTPDTAWRADDGRAVDAPPLDASLAGRRVAVTFTGPVAESYPVQATAASVTLLDPCPPALVEPAGPAQLTGVARRVVSDGQGRVVELAVAPGRASSGGPDGETLVRVDDDTTWFLATPAGLVGTPDAPLVGNGLEPAVDVRLDDGVARWVTVHLPSPTRSAD